MSNKICIIGVGYVGEHLLNSFKEHYNVIGVDLSERRVNLLRNKYKGIHFQTTYDEIEGCDVFLVSVPTLVKNDTDLDLSCLYSVRDTLKTIAKPGSLIMVESSVYVGATKELFGEFRHNGVFVGFSPERVDPGRTEPPMELIPKVISGVDESSLQRCSEIYGRVFQTIVPVSSTECAEMCKLYENCFRMVNIAYVNEISDMCDEKGISVHEMINASSTKPFGFMPFYPGLGVGGHCIPFNPYYLTKNGTLPVLEYSTHLMEKRPMKKANELVRHYQPNTVLVVGIGFKKGESLTTNSPGLALYKEFVRLGKHVDVYDPIVQSEYLTNDTMTFLSTCNFNSNVLYDKYDLVVVNLETAEEDCSILHEYERLGGKLHSFISNPQQKKVNCTLFDECQH
jgi:nucleotide sugar dehydrogenase